MKLSVNIIFEHLPFSRRKLWDSPLENRLIEDILFLHEGIDAFTPDHLYIGPTALIPPRDQIPDGTSFLCCGSAPFAMEEAPRFNLIVVEEEVPMYALFNSLQRIVTKYNHWQRSLENALQTNAPLQEFVDCSTEIIGWPLAVIDVAQSTLAISDFEESDDPIWNDQKKGYIRTSLLVQDSVQNEDVEASEGPVQLYSTISRRILLSQAIRIRSHTVAFLSAHRPTAGTERFSRCTEQLLEYLAKAVAKRMESNESYQNSRGFILDCLITDLIDGKITEREAIEDRLKYARWVGYVDSRIYTIRLREENPNKASLRSMMEQLENLLLYAKALYYKGSIVVLQQLHGTDPLSEDGRFLQWLRAHDAVCGISNTFSDYGQLATYYVQAKKADHFGHVLHPGQSAYAYQDYIQEHIYEILSQSTDLRMFIHPDVQQLMCHNKTKDYIYDTLRCLIKNDFNIINTSKEMFVHKNTLSYRIHQIEDLACFSFNDPNVRSILTASIGILSYMVLFQHYDIRTDTYDLERGSTT